jgi:hypothetical protein
LTVDFYWAFLGATAGEVSDGKSDWCPADS